MDAVAMLEKKLEDMVLRMDQDGYSTDRLEVELTKEEAIAIIKKLLS